LIEEPGKVSGKHSLIEIYPLCAGLLEDMNCPAFCLLIEEAFIASSNRAILPLVQIDRSSIGDCFTSLRDARKETIVSTTTDEPHWHSRGWFWLMQGRIILPNGFYHIHSFLLSLCFKGGFFASYGSLSPLVQLTSQRHQDHQ
jgi:hypothetical protein